MKQPGSTSKIKEIVNFFRFDFWNWLRDMPKCKHGGYCNTNVSNYYSKAIKGLNRSEVIYGYKYFCGKCGKNISKHFEDQYLWNLSREIKKKMKN